MVVVVVAGRFSPQGHAFNALVQLILTTPASAPKPRRLQTDCRPSYCYPASAGADIGIQVLGQLPGKLFVRVRYCHGLGTVFDQTPAIVKNRPDAQFRKV
jgi:hypothetical protein